MKKRLLQLLGALSLTAMMLLQQGCIKDKCVKNYTYTYYVPLYKTSAEVRANIKSSAPKAIVNPGKITIKDNFIYLNEINKGIHIIDNTNPAAPVNIGFIAIPGNVDIAIKNNMLYADLYTDLVTIDITDPENAMAVNFVSGVFPERFYYGYVADSTKMIYDWTTKTETVQCSCENPNPVYNDVGVLLSSNDAGSLNAAVATPVGISGSLSRFALVNNYLYAVSAAAVKTLNISNPSTPVITSQVNTNWMVETIYPFKDKLFVGGNAGMFVFNIQNPANPSLLGSFSHARVCDPVIADDNYAYVTLHSGTACQGFTNQLDVLDISSIQSPQLLRSYPFTSPRGLSKDGNLLFICDGDDGLKVLDAANPNGITLQKQIPIIGANEVIAFNQIALVVAKDGLYQYDYSDRNAIKLISAIKTGNP
ncbi:MAG: hypothetical protein JST86_11090 [Bacteroidetes bacterium]|nr:hypothetical protein [Bacteroidota bacterium]